VVRRTSDPSDDYNCIAWAANEDFRVWWPDPRYIGYWPDGIAREETVEAFVAAYATLGYEPCDNGDLEQGFEKIALYLHQGKPTHAARQLATGSWSSKLGPNIDVEHDTPEAIITEIAVLANIYGMPAKFLRRVR
jgi:hypothetical protein